MSGQNKNTPPTFPMRPPYPFPIMNIDKIGNLSNPSQKNMNVPQQGLNIPHQLMGQTQAPSFHPQRMFNPFMGGYGMMPMPPFIPYSPFGRQGVINPSIQNQQTQQRPQANIQNRDQSIAYFNPPKKSSEIIEVEQYQKPMPAKKNTTHHVISPQNK